MDKLIVNFTPTGMIPQKTQTPHVPVLTEEIIDEVLRAYELGITMVHIHVRDPKTHKPSYHMEDYAQVIEGIRKYAPDLVICVSTSGRVFASLDERAEVLKLTGNLMPDMASLTLSSLNFNAQASVNEPDTIKALASMMLSFGIKPELEVFDIGMANYAKYLIKKELLRPPYYFNLILGNVACAQASMLHAGLIINELPEKSIISIGGVGDSQLCANSLAISMGYGVRTGLEDNIWYDRGRTVLATNSMLLDRIIDIAKANERELMTPSELRSLLGLKGGFGSYGVSEEL